MTSTKLRNYPMQANGAEMLRIACCLATEDGVEVCAPVHDAVLIEAADHELDDKVRRTRRAMDQASEAVLDGLEVRTSVEVVRWPARYTDPRGAVMWTRINKLLDRYRSASVRPQPTSPAPQRRPRACPVDQVPVFEPASDRGNVDGADVDVGALVVAAHQSKSRGSGGVATIAAANNYWR